MSALLTHRLNVLGLVGTALALFFAFGWQVAYHELPCPLCMLQRAGFVAAGLGFLLNLRFGEHLAHYAAAILGAGIGAAASLRQVLLHIVPGSGAYGSPFLGYHFYTWAFILQTALIAYCALLMLVQWRRGSAETAPPVRCGSAPWAGLAFVVAVALMLLAGFAECGIGPCPDDPVGYWLLGTGKMSD
jgi:disulfide bond formation protein DsbB